MKPGDAKAHFCHQQGLTFVELMIAMLIAAVIAVAVGYSIAHLFNMNTRNSNYMIAVRQVQSAGYWVTRDAEMARPELTSTTVPGKLLSLAWYDTDNTTITHSADFTLDKGVLYRRYDSGDKSAIASHIAATIDQVATDENGHIVSFVFNVTASVTTRGITGNESRDYEVTLRPGAQ